MTCSGLNLPRISIRESSGSTTCPRTSLRLSEDAIMSPSIFLMSSATFSLAILTIDADFSIRPSYATPAAIASSTEDTTPEWLATFCNTEDVISAGLITIEISKNLRGPRFKDMTLRPSGSRWLSIPVKWLQ